MKNVPLIVLIFCLLPTTGCQQKSKHEIVSSSVNESQLLTRTKTTKPGASVSLASANMITIDENKESTVVVLLKAQSTSGVIQIKLNSSEGLQVLSGNEIQDVRLNADGYYQLPVSLLAPNSGRYYLNLHVVIGNAENFTSRALAVIVKVGPFTGADQLPLQMKKSVTGENIISLPAQETINTK